MRPSRRRDPYSRLIVRLPERDLAESILELAAPLLEPLGATSGIEEARAAIELAVTGWNAHVAASVVWGNPRQKDLTALRKRMRGKAAAPGEAATFDMLCERWRRHFALDPRLVRAWTYDADEHGARWLVCEMALPEGVYAEVPPPIEKRIAIGGKFLDEVRIRQSATSYLRYPTDNHRAVVDDRGIATIHTRMPTALQLFAEGGLTRLGGESIEVSVGGRELGPMLLSELRCGSELGAHDVAILVFQSARDRSAG